MSEQLPTPPDPGEQTKAQSPLGPFYAGDSLLWANGGSSVNPCGFPFYERMYGRSNWTYRWMLNHPVIQHVRSNHCAPIVANSQDYKKANEDVPDDYVDLVRRNFEPLRRRKIEDALRGRDFGKACFEPIWDIGAGEYRLAELKPLSVDLTTIIADDNGRFLGFAQGGLAQKKDANGKVIPELPAPYKAWLYTYDKECGNLHGRSWLENIRETAWKDWLDCAQQLQKLGAKISGTQCIIKSPEDMKDASIALVKAIAAGTVGGWLPNLAFAIDPRTVGANAADGWKLLTQLTKLSLTELEVLDFGDSSPAITGILARMKHDEELMYEGGHLSSRTGQEGQHGTKAEAQVHKDTGITVSELDDSDIAQQAQVLVDAVLVLNKGPKAAGTVIIDPSPLEDDKAQRDMELMTIMNADTPFSRALQRVVDVDRLLKDRKAPMIRGAKFVPPEEPTPVDPNAVPVNGKINGNGKNGTRTQRALQGFAKRIGMN